MARKIGIIISGTKAGGVKAAATNKLRHGNDFYVKIGAKGGHAGLGNTDRGFGSLPPEVRREAGRKGGLAARRGKAQWK